MISIEADLVQKSGLATSIGTVSQSGSLGTRDKGRDASQPRAGSDRRELGLLIRHALLPERNVQPAARVQTRVAHKSVGPG
ncbi:hypothetical protein PoB_000981700 [Plakobranchus ocellatus]|uniref:Uncharacterized protein n=1 Tax=Plakobranchus ocellatus TaxID=259542 RepID=A0AAV3YK94_9GAST|nr:hypothetical protein PoB_000981700 [Plakobranchus ocellatus]